jgi:hypothetical protein
MRSMSLPAVSHTRGDETPEAKAAWFQSLTLPQRMELLCAFTELILAVNPQIVEQRDAQPAGRVVDLKDVRLLELRDSSAGPAA